MLSIKFNKKPKEYLNKLLFPLLNNILNSLDFKEREIFISEETYFDGKIKTIKWNSDTIIEKELPEKNKSKYIGIRTSNNKGDSIEIEVNPYIARNGITNCPDIDIFLTSSTYNNLFEMIKSENKLDLIENILDEFSDYLLEYYFVNRELEGDLYTDLFLRVEPKFYVIKHFIKLLYLKDREKNKENYYYKQELINKHETLIFNEENMFKINDLINSNNTSFEIGSLKIRGNINEALEKINFFLDSYLKKIDKDKYYFKHMSEEALNDLISHFSN